MKNVFIKYVSVAFLMLFSTNAIAATEVTVGCLKYTLNGNTATVSGYTSDLPKDLEIPATIEYNDMSFSVTAIKSSAFSSCKLLESVIVPESVTNVNGFSGCTNLKNATLKGVEYITIFAFNDCTSLKWINLGNRLSKIDQSAFRNCSSLSYLVFPSTLTWIYGSTVGAPFEGCNLIQNVIYLGTQKLYPFKNANIYTRDSIITWKESSFTYNGSSPVYSYTNNLPVNFKPTNETSWPALKKNAGNHTTNIAMTFSNSDMSFDVEIPYSYTIKKANLTATIDDTSKVYGTKNPTFNVSFSGFVNEEDESVIDNKGVATSTATNTSKVGTYPISLTGAYDNNYNISSVNAVLTITKAPLTATVNNANRKYGSNNPTFTTTYKGFVNNDNVYDIDNTGTYKTEANVKSDVGTYNIKLQNITDNNYDITTVDGTLTITKAPLTANVQNATKVYGTENPSFKIQYDGFLNNDDATDIDVKGSFVTEANNSSEVGVYTVKYEGESDNNYEITPIEGKLTVTKATLNAKVNDSSRIYGDNNPSFTTTFSGFVNNDTEESIDNTGKYTTNATAKSNVGTYYIRLEGASDNNYNIVTSNGTLTITKANLIATADDKSKTYGEANPTFTLSYTGLKNDETEPAWVTTPKITTTADKNSSVGEYDIIAQNGEAVNYDITYQKGILIVGKANLTLTANNATRKYFESNPEFTYTVNGLVAEDDINTALTSTPTLSTTATKDSETGSYPISIDGASSNNYSLSYIPANLEITKRTLAVSTNNYSRSYGENNPEFEINYTGFVNNEDEKVLITKPSASTTADETSNVGTYDIIIEGGFAQNYDFNYTNGILTINKAYQTLSWDQQLDELKIYDQVELLATSTSGLKVEYMLDPNDFCSIYNVGDKTYLDCKGIGEISIYAIQGGNDNYYGTTKIYKNIKITDPTGINEVTATGKYNVSIADGRITIEGTKDNQVVAIYSLSGTLVYKGTSKIIPVQCGTYIIKIGNWKNKIFVR